MNNITIQHVDTVEYAETLYDLLVDFTNADGDVDLTVAEWAAVRRSLIESLKASIEADKALGHDVD
jgi:hypothetical protein